MLLFILLAACSPGNGGGDAVLLEPEASPGVAATIAADPTTTAVLPDATVLGTVVTAQATGTTTSTTEPTTTTAPTKTTRPPPVIEGPEAADFTFALEGGEVFTLNLERRPILLYFWADW